MDLDHKNLDHRNLNKSHSQIDHLQKIFFNRNTNFTMYKIAFKKLLEIIPIDNNTVELIDMMKNLYKVRSDEEQFNREIKYLIIIWMFIFLIGVVSNAYVIVVLTKVRKKIVYEIFCIGLAVTDLSILVFTLPFTILHYGMGAWIFGDVICRLVNFVVYVAIFSSTMMLLTLTMTRFVAVVYPWENRSISTQKAKLACYIIWMLGATFSTPVLLYFGVNDGNSFTDQYNISSQQDTDPSRPTCHSNFPNELLQIIYFVLVFLLTYILPFKTIIVINAMIVRRLKREFGQRKNSNFENVENKVSSSFMTKSKASMKETGSRQRRSRVTKIVILVTMLYGISWLPTQIVNFWYYISPKDFPTTRRMQYIKFISQTLSYASACINPIVYSVMSDTFKKSQKRICPCCFQKLEAITTLFYDFEDKRYLESKMPCDND